MKSRSVAASPTASRSPAGAAIALDISVSATTTTQPARGRSLQRKFKLDPHAKRTWVGVACQTAQVGPVVPDSTRGIDPQFAEPDVPGAQVHLLRLA